MEALEQLDAITAAAAGLAESRNKLKEKIPGKLEKYLFWIRPEKFFKRHSLRTDY